MRRLLLALANGLLVAALTLASSGGALAQDGGEDAFIANLFQRMSPDVRIGQLFVVAFDGTDASEASAIAELILDYHVGGVILSADHGNIVDSGDRTPVQVARLTAALQLLVAKSSASPQPDGPAVPFIPLFTALEQDGGGPAYSELTSGLTPQPGPLAIGATWNTTDAQEVGRFVGGELSALGVNFLIGPSLDVLTQPDPDGGDAGVRSFGGDPYWVGALAGAFVRGVREGSGGRIAVALKHFPGEGGLQRDSDTINQSLDQLQRIDLEPYFTLMRVPEGETRPLADAALTTHARFRGFTGLRETTAPISVDATALSTLLQLPHTAAWREPSVGGLMVSGSLGDDKLRRSYDPTLTTFRAEQIALDAFLAGNDLLILNDFSLTRTASGEAETIKASIRAFRQRYSEDLGFQDRVDSAVKRILRLKYRLYPSQRDFLPTDVVAAPGAVDARLRQGLPVVERVAQDALTRLYPGSAQIEAAPPPTPAPDDSFLIFTDDHFVVDCSRCPERTTLFTNAISQTLVRTADVPPGQITSLGFADLKSFLAGVPTARDLTNVFAQADWIILAQQNLQSDVQQSDAARLLLRDRSELIANKRVALFVFGPPYELTADDLKSLTTSYALYDMATPFVEAAVRALFGQLQPVGESPVSVEAIGYDLTTQTEPDPNRSITLDVGEAAGPSTPTPEPPILKVGDSIIIRTGLILDRNGHPVPDETPVQFTLIYRDADDFTEEPDADTISGAASIAVTIQFNGRLEIRASSEPALRSDTLELTIAEGEVTTIRTIEPPPTPTPTRRPTLTPTSTQTSTPTSTPVALIDSLLGAEPRRVNLIDFVLSMLGITLVEAWAYRAESKRNEEGAIDRAVRLALWGSLCGLAAYAGYGLGLPGADAIRAALGGWAALVVTLFGAAAPWLVDRVRQRMVNG
ncbi:MAG: glycoside hydrolase family 3 N-terminal domain-containing protein [Anaerolineae bacterium]